MSDAFDWAKEDKAMARKLAEGGTYPVIPGQLTVEEVIDSVISEKVCPVCEATEEDIGFGDEVYGDQGTGYEMKMCFACGYVWPDDGTTETRHWVGL